MTATPDLNAQNDAPPAVDPVVIETIIHDIFLVGLAAAAFFIKNPQTAQRAGQVVGILQGLNLGPQR